MVTPSTRREGARHLVEKGKSSQRKACQLLSLSRSQVRYAPRKNPEERELRAEIRKQAAVNSAVSVEEVDLSSSIGKEWILHEK